MVALSPSTTTHLLVMASSFVACTSWAGGRISRRYTTVVWLPVPDFAEHECLELLR